MSTMERLFAEIFDRKSRIEHQLHQQLESYGESLACNVIADGIRPPQWLLDLVPSAQVCLDPAEFRQPSSFWNTKRKTCSATWEFIQGTLPRNDFNIESSIHDFVIPPIVDKQNESPHIVEEFHSACSRDVVRPTNLIAFKSDIHHASRGDEKLFSNVDTFENKGFESIDHHDGRKEGEEPSEALQRLYRCDIIGISDTVGVKSSCDETMTEFKGSNIDLPCVLEDNTFCKDDFPSLGKEQSSTSPHVVEEFLSVRSMDEVRLTNLMLVESQIDCTSPASKKLFSNVDTFENKACEIHVHYDVSEEGEEPYNVRQHLHRCDVTGASGTAGVKSCCDETTPDIKVSSIDLPYTVDVNISKETDIPSLLKERSSATPHVVDETLSVCSRDAVRTSNLIPCESEIHHTSHSVEKLFSHMDTSENKPSHSIGHHDGFEEDAEPYDVTQGLDSCDVTTSEFSGFKPLCDETMLDGSNINLLCAPDDNIVFQDADIPSFAKERASITHILEEIHSGCLRDETMLEFEGSSIDLPYAPVDNIALNDADIPSFAKEQASITPHIVEEIHSACSRDETMLEFDDSNIDLPYAPEDYIVLKDADIPSFAKEQASITHIIEEIHSACSRDETMLKFDSSNIDFPYAPDDNIVFIDVDIPNFSKERASITPHIAEEILSGCSRDEIRQANFVPFESEIHPTSHCSVNAIKNKASKSLCHHDGSEEDEEPYDAPYRCDITTISDTVGVKSCYDENMPEFEGFSVDLPYEEENIVCKDADIPSLEKERAFVIEQLRQSRILLTPRSKPSIMNRIDIISDDYNASPLGVLQNMNLGLSLEHNDPDIKHFTASSSIKLIDMICNNGSKLDGPAFGSSLSLSSSSARFSSEFQNLSLTPPAIKFIHERLSGKRSSSSVKVSSNPELICFRIDENSSTTEENAEVQVDYSTHRASSRNIEVSTNSKPLSDVTSLCQNDTCYLSNFKEFVVRDSMESVNSDTASSLGFEYAGRESNIENKDNFRYTDEIKQLRKTTRTVSKMSERSRVSCRSSDRISNCKNIGKGCKPSNILSSISSFIPQIQQKKQQALLLQRKKDVKVKALEAAEAAKRLEDQMKIEREKRKAALKLEREKLKQENAKLLKLKQKQKDEERRKKEDVAARKRQREFEERKVKDRKRQCIEKPWTLQRDQKDKLCFEKAEKDIRHKVNDEKQKAGKQSCNGGQNKFDRAEGTESQMAPEKQYCTIKPAATKTIPGDEKVQALEESGEHNSFEKGVGGEKIEVASATQISLELQSYEMSPYQTSDDEDMEEDRRHIKHIPQWASGDRLGEIILANQQLNPQDIFSRKRSFNVSQVLTRPVLCRRPLK